MDADQVKLSPSWKERLLPEFQKDYMHNLKSFLSQEIERGKQIFPAGPQWFHALDSTAFEDVKVVIIGQDPYHGIGQAHGLCFSVQPGVPIPPSLRNIYKELAADIGFQPVRHGFLQHWAEQGVLLLNAVLSVESGRAGSHAGRGWELFTDAVIHRLAEEREGLAFVLWGSYAQKKGAFINPSRHLVLKSPHLHHWA